MKNIIYRVCFVLLCCGCSGSSGSIDVDEGNPDENPDTNIELKVSLQFPHENGLCNIGANLTPTESTVFFEWEASKIAESYTIYITNLIDGSKIEDNTSEDKIGILLDRATPYSWYVESKAGSKTVDSDTWKFYNSGPGVETYAPFPATINSPSMAASLSSGTISLRWTGNDVDNDIQGYDIYLGTNNPPEIHTSDVNSADLDVVLNTGTYFWNVITKDTEGNTSESGIYQFKIE